MIFILPGTKIQRRMRFWIWAPSAAELAAGVEEEEVGVVVEETYAR